MSCFNYISPEAAERFFSDEAKKEKLGWFPPELLVSGRQARRMRRLAASEKVTDRVVAAGNPSTPLAILWSMAYDEPSVQVRGWVARNPAAPKELLWYLTKDEDEGIAAYARFRLDNET